MTALIWLLLYGSVGVAIVREVTKRTTRDPLAWPWWGIALLWPIALSCLFIAHRNA